MIVDIVKEVHVHIFAVCLICDRHRQQRVFVVAMCLNESECFLASIPLVRQLRPTHQAHATRLLLTCGPGSPAQTARRDCAAAHVVPGNVDLHPKCTDVLNGSQSKVQHKRRRESEGGTKAGGGEAAMQTSLRYSASAVASPPVRAASTITRSFVAVSNRQKLHT